MGKIRKGGEIPSGRQPRKDRPPIKGTTPAEDDHYRATRRATRAGRSLDETIRLGEEIIADVASEGYFLRPDQLAEPVGDGSLNLSEVRALRANLGKLVEGRMRTHEDSRSAALRRAARRLKRQTSIKDTPLSDKEDADLKKNLDKLGNNY
ncbi:MAG TPA: hypothetical protein VN711_04940 [Candidatus Saccharimonadales bacterium]|nr:hypothetical protein [Candidatus Saccharimonadales bacterium]